MDELRLFFERYLPHQDLSPLLSAFSEPKSFKKRTMMIQPGERCSQLAFVGSGCFRVYFINEVGIEITTWFSFQGAVVTDLLAYLTDSPATFFVEAIEDSQIVQIDKMQLEKLIVSHPEYEKFARNFAEEALVMVIRRMVSLQTKSAKERYLEVLGNPNVMQRIPLKHLATYLGITETSLSRIRAEISK